MSDTVSKHHPFSFIFNLGISMVWVCKRTILSDRCLSAKLVPTFGDRGCHVVSVTNPYGLILDFLDQNRCFFFQVAPHEAEWTLFRTHYFSENLVTKQHHKGLSVRWVRRMGNDIHVVVSHHLSRVKEQSSEQCGACSNVLLRSPGKLHNWFQQQSSWIVLKLFQHFLFCYCMVTLNVCHLQVTFDWPQNVNAIKKPLSGLKNVLQKPHEAY
jgi:hypothetical protein